MVGSFEKELPNGGLKSNVCILINYLVVLKLFEK